jgi:hypothetical protein
MPLVSELLIQPPGMLVDLLEFQIKSISSLLDIKTEIIRSSSLRLGVEGRDKIHLICKSLEKNIYKNAIGGRSLYNCEAFKTVGVELRFVSAKEKAFAYSDGKKLSIIDFLMRVPEAEWLSHLNQFEELK